MPYIPIIPIIIVVLLILLFAFVPMRLWITALASGSHVGIGTLIGMRQSIAGETEKPATI